MVPPASGAVAASSALGAAMIRSGSAFTVAAGPAAEFPASPPQAASPRAAASRVAAITAASRMTRRDGVGIAGERPSAADRWWPGLTARPPAGCPNSRPGHYRISARQVRAAAGQLAAELL